jgi:hypothetical protein
MDVLATGLPAIFLALVIQVLFVWADGRLAMGIQLLVLSSFLVGVSIFSGSKIRPLLAARFLHTKKVVN